MLKLTVTLCVVLALAVAAVSASSGPPGCQQEGLDSATYNTLIANLTSESNGLVREDMFKAFLTTTHSGFTGTQIVGVLELFSNSLVAEEVLQALVPYSLDLTCDDGRDILNVFHSELDGLDVLADIAPLLVDTRSNNATILAFFNNTFNREDAEALLQKTPQASCVWPPSVTLYGQIAFVVDTSGSMSTLFPYDGSSVSRIQYVRNQLKEVIQQTLLSSQQFNIIEFASSATEWSQGVQPVDSSNIDAAVQWINGLSAGGSTAMMKGLELAFSDDDVEAVFLLTDGEPNGSRDAIVQAAQAWAGDSKSVNTIAFTAGAPDPAAGAFMKTLASSCNGVYRIITG